MTAASTAPPRRPETRPAPPSRWWSDPTILGSWAFGAANAIAFFVLRPGVNDLWAARARASAAENGVGLGYWFSWFGGGSTPGNYSIVTPYLSAAIGTELVGALSAVAVVVLVSVAVRGTPHAYAATWVGAVAVVLNLWSGRVPFLLGAVAGVAALIAVRRGHRIATVALTLAAMAASPVVGALLVIGLSGTFLTTRTKAYRPIIAYVFGTVAVALAVVAVMFGTPGPQPVSGWLLLELPLLLAAIWLGGPPDHLRTTIYVSLLALFALWVVPNGLGSNFSRFVWFCLPVAVVALSSRSARLVVLAVVPALVLGGITTVTDLRRASSPVSSVSYYDTLAAELDRLPDLQKYRVEVVDHGAHTGFHTGYDALLDHAWLARGWESQEDNALNPSLDQDALDPVTYKVWLDNNAVGYVAVPSAPVGDFPEYRLVAADPPPYMQRVWYDMKWDLYRVLDPTPIAAKPAAVLARDQKSLTVKVPCACRIAVRVRWSKFLSAVLQDRGPAGPGTVDADPIQRALVADDGFGWTVVTTHRPGTYMLRGSIRGLLH
jgi:hypothetical protein